MPKPVMMSWTLIVALIVLAWVSEASADRMDAMPRRLPPGGFPGYGGMPIQHVSGVTSRGGSSLAGQPGAMPAPMPRPMRYPQMHAPMYPSPVPNVPVQVGGTTYTNQAFAPHEMLYAHKYRALYPPFYYKVSGRWWWTPFGMESHDKWELQGTEVRVNYRSSYAPFSGFFPPGCH